MPLPACEEAPSPDDTLAVSMELPELAVGAAVLTDMDGTPLDEPDPSLTNIFSTSPGGMSFDKSITDSLAISSASSSSPLVVIPLDRINFDRHFFSR